MGEQVSKVENGRLSVFSERKKDLAPVVRQVDSAIHWINYYPKDSAIGFRNTFEQPGPAGSTTMKMDIKLDNTFAPSWPPDRAPAYI